MRVVVDKAGFLEEGCLTSFDGAGIERQVKKDLASQMSGDKEVGVLVSTCGF